MGRTRGTRGTRGSRDASKMLSGLALRHVILVICVSWIGCKGRCVQPDVINPGPKLYDVCLRIECQEHLRSDSAQQNMAKDRYNCCQDVVDNSSQQDDAVIPMPQTHRAYGASDLQTRNVNSTQQQAHCKRSPRNNRPAGPCS